MGFQRKERSSGSEEERRERTREGRIKRVGREMGGRERESYFNMHRKKTTFLFPISRSAKPTPLTMWGWIYLFIYCKLGHMCSCPNQQGLLEKIFAGRTSGDLLEFELQRFCLVSLITLSP